MRTLPAMSLNRAEQTLFDYIQGHAEERHHWQMKVREAMVALPKDAPVHGTASHLAEELWQYHQERCTAGIVLDNRFLTKGMPKISMRNLAEYLMRVWGPEPRRIRAAGEA